MRLRHAWMVGAASILVGCSVEPGVGGIAEAKAALSSSGPLDIVGSRLHMPTGSRFSGAPGQLKNGFRVHTDVLKNRILVGAPPDTGLVLPHWNDSFESNGIKYTSTTLGTDPALGQTTTIPVTITPYRLVFADGTVLDASTDVIDGVTPVQGVIDSPIFEPAPFSAGGTSLGVTQWGDAVLRANYWERIPKQDGYHVLLVTPTVAPTVTVNVPELYGVTTVDPKTGRRVGLASFQWLKDLIENQIIASGVTPDRLSINLFSEVIMTTLSGGHAFGYHFFSDFSATTGIPGVNSYIESGYFGKAFSFDDVDSSGTYVLGHEVAEWIADPAVENPVPGWQIPTRAAECYSSAREIADPIEDTPVSLEIPSQGRVYRFPDVVFDAYFRRDQRSRAVNRQLTFLDTFKDPSIPCSYDRPGSSSFWFTDSTTGASITTVLTGLNNDQGAVGYLQTDDGFTFGFALDGYDPAVGKLGTSSFVTVPASDLPGYVYNFTMPTGIRADGTVVGYYFDGAQYHGFVQSNEQYTTVDVPGAAHTFVLGTNSRSRPDLVGQYVDASGQLHGFVLRDGKVTTIDAPFGPSTSVNAINNQRQIVGSYDLAGDRAGFRASLPQSGADDRAGDFVSVTFPQNFGPGTHASLELTSVNGPGEIIGVLTASNANVSLVYPFELVNGVFQFLGVGLDWDEAPAGIANAVNDAGIIVGGMVIPEAALAEPFGVLAETWIPYNLILAAQAQGKSTPGTLGPIAASRPALVAH